MELDDDDLELLGYGNQWQKTIEKAAPYEVERRASDIERLNDWVARNPEKHAEAIKRWAANRRDEIKHLVGVSECHCGKKLTVYDLMFRKEECSKCRK